MYEIVHRSDLNTERYMREDILHIGGCDECVAEMVSLGEEMD